MIRSGVLFMSLMLLGPACEAQNLSVTHRHDIPSDCKGMSLTMIHDLRGKPFLYVASKDAGLKIYEISGVPRLVKSIPAASFNGLHVMNLSQSGSDLYLALGNHFGFAAQKPGFAIVDVSTPENATVLSVWDDARFKSGAGAVLAVGNFLYLGAMKDGLMIFDISNRTQVKQISSYVPDIHFPDRIADQSKINARGLVAQNDFVYLCYDAGGFRIIDVRDKAHPFEAGRYSNPVLNGRPRAYNNVVVDASLAYVTTDYCGLEILDVSKPTAIKLLSWWNPWNCPGGPLQWFKSPGHSNEIALDKQRKLLFLSTGRSDLDVLSVSDPAAPSHVLNYGGTENDLGTWGISLFENEIYLSYICAFIPFPSKWTGIRILDLRP